MSSRARRRSSSRLGAMLVACLLATAGLGSAPSVALAGSPSAFVLDTLRSGDEFPAGVNHVVRAFHDPGDSNILVEWTGTDLYIGAEPTDGNFLMYRIAPGNSQPFSVGTFASATVDGCAGSVTVHSITPEPQLGVATAIASVSASFSRSCGAETTYGELRYHSDDPFAAIGLTQSTGIGPELAMVGAPASFVGRRTAESTVTLKNLGTTTLTIGSPTFDPSPKVNWTITSNTCTGTLPAGDTCSISGTALSWIPGGFEDYLTLPVNTAHGKARIFAPSSFAAATFVPINPVRLLDTRTGLGISSSLKTGVARTFTVIDRAPSDPAVNIPSDAVAVTGNLIITKPTSSGYAAVTTTASNSPSIRTLYLPTGDTRSNALITRLSPSGTLGVTWVGSAGSSAHAIFDATGYFVPTDPVSGLRSGNFRPWAPTQVVNTATGLGISSKLVAGKPRTFNVPLVGVDWNSTAVAGSITVIKPAKNGYLYIGPAPLAAPRTSVLHFRANTSGTSSVIAKLSDSPNPETPKTLSITYVGPAGSSVDVRFDIHGSFGSGWAGYVPLVPNRLVDSVKGKGLSKALAARKAKYVAVSNRTPTDPSRNVPPDSSIGTLLFKAGLTGNLWMVKPTAAGALAAVPPHTTIPPKTWMVRAPAKDRRASSVIIGKGGSPVDMTLYYSAPSGSTTHVIFDVTGYFLYP